MSLKEGYLLQTTEEKVIRSKKEICEKRILFTDLTALQEAMKKTGRGYRKVFRKT